MMDCSVLILEAYIIFINFQAGCNATEEGKKEVNLLRLDGWKWRPFFRISIT
jgi:hypothetical protein